MTIDVLSEYLKINVRNTVNKMEKKQKIVKAIICIITALLIAGCFIAMAFMPKMFEQNSASADVVENPPTEQPTRNEILLGITATTNLQATPTQSQIYAQTTNAIQNAYIDFLFEPSAKINISTIKLQIAYSGYRSGSVLDSRFFNNNTEAARILMESTLYSDNLYDNKNITITNNSTECNKLRIYLTPYTGTENSWISIYKLAIQYETTNGRARVYNYESYMYKIIEDTVNNAKEQGYNEGHEAGYNAGYQVGYDKGIVSDWQSPVEIFIKPVDIFLSTNIFGSISIGDILSIILFVMVGIIFIKMFAGG